MRYKVVYVKLKNPPRNVQPPDLNIQERKPETKVRQTRNMILVDNSESSFVERKNAINKMVNTGTPDDLRENEQKETFQYQLPRVRASFTLKESPDSTTADLPEPTSTNELANSSDKKEALADKKYDANLPPNEANLPPNGADLPQYGPHLPEHECATPEFEHNLPDFRPRVPAQPSVISHVPRIPRPILANRSNHYIHNDDKDFEIPLEESLRAVEEFIKREKELAKWRVGEDVLARWKGNGLFYKAKILEIFSSGVVVILFDSYDITDDIDYRDLCKFFKKTNNFVKKKGRPQDKPQVDDEKKNTVIAKKEMKIKKRKKKPSRRPHFVSIFKRSDRLRKKRLFALHKKHLSIIKSKNKSDTTTVEKEKSMS